MKTDIRKTLEPLELLYLDKCDSIGATVEQMAKCPIGAGMIGRTAETLYGLVKSGKEPIIIYDGKKDSELGKLIEKMVSEKKWFAGQYAPEEYSDTKVKKGGVALVVGGFSERFEDAIFEKPDRTIFINNYNQIKPGQVRDGVFTDFVHGDPGFVVPVLYWTLEERLEGKKISFMDFWKDLSKYGGVAAQAAHGMETFQKMLTDPDCTVIATFSGIMTVGKMGDLIVNMINRFKNLKSIFATGALIAHGFVEGVNLKHYKYNPRFTDEELADQKLNRITDCLEPEENLDHVEDVLGHILNEKISGDETISPSDICKLVGEHLAQKYPDGPSILRDAHKKNIGVFVPALIDSELGNDILVNNISRKKEGKKPIVVDCEIDSRRLVDIATGAKKLGIFTIGGGVPRNNVQNVAPLVEIMNVRLGLNLKENRFFYGCRICPDLPYWGHLSGCTYSEGSSWRKTDFVHGRFSEILIDGTMVFPFFMATMKELMEKDERQK